MLELKNFGIRLKKDGRALLEHFSFTLRRGDKAVIIGEEGNGKSTLLKSIHDRSLVSGYCECEGTVITRGKTGYLPQMMAEEDREKTLAGYFDDTPYYRYTRVLAELGLSVEFLLSEQKLGTLSGGEKVKVMLARILMEEPDVLLLDEPTNDLDIETLEWLGDYIAGTDLPVLFISHDETLIEQTANTILHMEQVIRKTKSVMTVARCQYSEYLVFRRNTFEHQTQVAQKQRDDYDRQMEKWRQIYSKVDHDQEVISRQNPGGGRLLKKKMHTVLAMGRRFEREKENFVEYPQQEDAILTRFDESITIPAGKTVLDFFLNTLSVGTRVLARDLALFVSGSEHIGITGRNGAGKSTLLALFWEILRERKDITAAYMPQDYATVLDFGKTPVEHLAAQYTKADITRARTFMGSMRFTHEEMTGKIGELSGGQKAKILFLDMVLHGADVLLLDEPTRNFSPLSAPVVRRALRAYRGAVISVSHDRKYLGEVCDRVFELKADGLQEVARS